MVRKLNRKLRERYKEERRDIEERKRFEEKRELERIEQAKPKLHGVSLFTPYTNHRLSVGAMLDTMKSMVNLELPVYTSILDTIDKMADTEIIEDYLRSMFKTEIMLDYMRRKLTYDFHILGTLTMNTMMNMLKLVDQMAYIEKCDLFVIEDKDYTPIKEVFVSMCGVDIFNRGYRHLEISNIDMEYESGSPERLFAMCRYISNNMEKIKLRYKTVALNVARVLEGK